jgi:hypothetical protein
MHVLRRIPSRVGVTDDDVTAMKEAVMHALADGPLTRRELNERIATSAAAHTKRWIEHILGFARESVVEGLTCYGPDRGSETTYLRVDQWLPERKEVPEDEAKRILLRRYLSAYGPGTLRDFTKWTGMPASETKPIWESIKEDLVEVSFEEKRGWILHDDHDALEGSGIDRPVLRLLPTFDPYMLGHVETDHLVAPANYKLVYRKAGWISSVVLLDGRVIAVWSYTRRGKRLLLKIEPFEKFPKAIRTMIEEEAESLGRFLGATSEIEFVDVAG